MKKTVIHTFFKENQYEEEEVIDEGQQTSHLDMTSETNDPFLKYQRSMMKLHNSIRKQKKHSEAKQVKEPAQLQIVGVKGLHNFETVFVSK